MDQARSPEAMGVRGAVFGGIVVAGLAAAGLVGATTAGLAQPGGQAANQSALDLKSETVLIVDTESGTTLFDKNGDKPFQAASLIKLMTAAVMFDLIKEGKLTLDQDFPVSEHAWRTGGAPSHTVSMFAPINSRVKVSDLLQGLIVQSANDAAIIAAEGIAGTEADFAILMQKKAADLGLTKSTFRNPSGLPDPDQKATARDFVKLAQYIVNTHPDLYKYFAQGDFTYNKIRQTNRNTLINAGIGADGLAVAGTKETGYHIVGSAVQDGQRIILVLGGAKTEKDRLEEAKKAVDWSFRNFEQFTLYKAGETIGEASVYGGTQSSVEVSADKPVRLLLQRNNRGKLSGKVIYTGPIRAPVSVGQAIGRLVVYRDNQPILETQVFAREDIGVGTVAQRATDAATEYVWVKIRKLLGMK